MVSPVWKFLALSSLVLTSSSPITMPFLAILLAWVSLSPSFLPEKRTVVLWLLFRSLCATLKASSYSCSDIGTMQ